MTSFHMAWRRYLPRGSTTWASRNDGVAIWGDSNEQRPESATVTKAKRFSAPQPRFARAVRIGRILGIAWSSLLITGAGACAPAWTGSIGVILGKDNLDGRLFVRDVPPGMSGATAGLVAGDEVVAIDGKPVVRMTPAEVHDALTGKVGTRVRLTVRRNGTLTDHDVERGPLAGT